VQQGGSLHDIRGDKIIHYARGLGNVLNNLVEVYML
jgi:hypothetical protein